MSIIPIVLSSDDNYVPFIAIAIASICYNTNSHVKVYLLEDNISFFHKNILKNFFYNLKILKFIVFL